ncbi:class II fructose-bisphosphate aldolase [Paratissierella segnis]|uniref:Class II fructose-bisphosphate aldolase n=1 Tax=Paratissierella segnis TaxID=2763679 RepID=A0A926EZB5_9FIRM|nr:class II fructose-bisphosphate aldolase [Paratissierella segnis]MBC8589159.1 class II fructose-bisphosphate aldolase [Paratissierella segnis]
MLISMAEILKDARKGKYGVAAPNVLNLETVQAVFEAARELKAPVIIDHAGMENIEIISKITKFYEKKYPEVVVTLNLDHGGEYEEIIQAIRSGFTSVMIDRSTLPYDENVAEVKEIVKIAHAVGVSVEAELGHVGVGYEYEETRDAGLTKPDEAVRYVKETGIDCLAVAIGTSHGTYKGTPHLDFELLKELSEIIDIPLVLHGGSGTGDENLKKAVELGIQKINLFTDLSNAGVIDLVEYVTKDISKEKHIKELGEFGIKSISLPEAFKEGVKGYKRALMHYMQLFNSAGKA